MKNLHKISSLRENEQVTKCFSDVPNVFKITLSFSGLHSETRENPWRLIGSPIGSMSHRMDLNIDVRFLREVVNV